MPADRSAVPARADRSRIPAVGPDPDFRFPEIARHSLANGLQIRTVQHDASPVITFVLQVEGGSGADPDGKEGLAAIVADMLDEGIGALSAIEVSDSLARLGAEYDIDVAPDVTTLSLTTLDRFSRRAASLLCDLVTKPSFRAHDFERVRQLRIDRLKQMKDLAPAVAERAFLRLVYGAHPYGHLPLGSAAALRHLSLEEAAAFQRETFHPSRATLVIGGPHSHADLLRIAEDAFGGWSPGDAPLRRAPAADVVPDAPSRRTLAVLPREAAAQSELRVGHLSAQRNTPDYGALIVMNAVLGGQFVSRLNLKLREEKGYTYGARTGFDWRRGVSPFVLQTSVHTAATADAVRDSLAEFEAIRGGRPVTDTELMLAKASLTRGYPRNFETVQQVARSVAQLALYGLPDSYFVDFVPTVNAITAQAVTAAARRYLDPGKLVTLVVGDHSAIADSLSTLGFSTIDVLPPEL
jgi:predicted Zn-dependent peptidase